jgi:exopolysaccharide biosynthesis polyprenyl glycosylphosphotransferase
LAEQNIDHRGILASGVADGFRVSSRAGLSSGVALAEGIVAALLLFGVAIGYHALVLHSSALHLPLALYVQYGLIVGLLYAAFSAAATARLLDRSRSQVAILADAAMGWTAAFGGALLLAFLAGSAGDLSRVSLTVAFAGGLPAMLMLRSAVYGRLMTRIRSGQLRYLRVAVMGDRDEVLRFLVNGHLAQSGYQLAGTLYREEALAEDGGLDPVAIVAAARRWVASGIENVILVGNVGDVDGLGRLSDELKRFALNAIVAPATANTSFKYLDVVPVGSNNALRFLRRPMGDCAVLAKRVFDLAGASFGLVLLAPLLALVSIAIALDSPGPLIYRQERRGFNGESFYIWKFRSMRVTEPGTAMRQAQKDDDRVTSIGRIIRRLSIDELPQLINVLRGEMSLVGPRPHAVAHDNQLGEQLASYAHRQRIKPGITGWAQVNGFRGETRTFAQVEGRTLCDLYYVDNWSLLLDCWIIVLTVFSPKSSHNAF